MRPGLIHRIKPRREIQQEGFTLVELIIAITISVILSLTIMGFMADELQQSTIASAKAELLNEAETGLNTVNSDIRLSANADAQNRYQDANAPDPNNPYSWQSNSSTLVLATAAQDSSGNILFDDPHQYITDKNNLIYFVQNGTLYKRILASPATGNRAATTCPATDASSSCPADKVILEGVSAFSVEYRNGDDQSVSPTDARSIILSVTLTANEYGQKFNESYSSRMVFRND